MLEFIPAISFQNLIHYDYRDPVVREITGHIRYMFVSHLTESSCMQVSRSIGDIYLKKTEFNREPLYAKFRLPEPFRKPILTAEPSIEVHTLQPYDQFIIFASDGLWEHFSNQEAVNLVHNHPRSVRCIKVEAFSFCSALHLMPPTP
jgi:serine/threonine protein phosphatase PrpC